MSSDMSWSGLKALVTGAGGFIGSHLVERLLLEGASVRALVRYNADGSWGRLREIPEELRPNMQVVFGDVRDAERTTNLARGREVIFHLAALISIPYSYQAPESFLDTNVRGTLNVLNAARREGGIRVIHTSTSEVYGTPETVPITESHPLRAQSPYAASKIGADKLAESFWHSYELPVTVVRPFNTYGPRQSARAVLPTILVQLLSGLPEVQLGALWPRRDLTFVGDTVEGLLKAAASDRAIGRVIQLGTGRDISIGDLAQLAMTLLNVHAEVVCKEERLRPPTSEVERLVSSPSLAGSLLGWHPTVSLEEGILRTAEWLRNHLHSYRPEQYMV